MKNKGYHIIIKNEKQRKFVKEMPSAVYFHMNDKNDKMV